MGTDADLYGLKKRSTFCRPNFEWANKVLVLDDLYALRKKYYNMIRAGAMSEGWTIESRATVRGGWQQRLSPNGPAWTSTFLRAPEVSGAEIPAAPPLAMKYR